MQVRRASDSTTLDIGFDSNGLVNTADIAAFCAGSVGTVSIWYDQGSLGQNATQSDTTKEPSIYDGTDFYYIDGQVCVRAASVGIGFNHTVSHTGDWTTLTVISADNPGAGSTGYTYGNGGGAGLGSVNGNIGLASLYYGAIDTISGESTFQTLFSVFIDSVGIDWFRNAIGNTGVGSGLSGFSFDHFMSRRVTDNSTIRMQEWIMWDSDLIAYSDAAAAYSVRKLSNTAIKCMRVRRTVPPFDEQDIGFTAGGDLDEAAITTFGGSDVLVVSRWYDQSGQSNHAVQISPVAQPQIYNGTSVLTENGKPAINFENTYRLQTLVAIPNGTVDIFAVAGRTSANAFIVIATSTANAFAGVGQDGSTGAAEAQFNSGIDYYINGTLISSPNRDKIYDNMGTQGLMSFDSQGASVAGLYYEMNYQTSGFGHLQMQEYIIYHTDKSGNRTAIETNINDYYTAIREQRLHTASGS
jgi:hypothetical protein